MFRPSLLGDLFGKLDWGRGHFGRAAREVRDFALEDELRQRVSTAVLASGLMWCNNFAILYAYCMYPLRN